MSINMSELIYNQRLEHYYVCYKNILDKMQSKWLKRRKLNYKQFIKIIYILYFTSDIPVELIYILQKYFNGFL